MIRIIRDYGELTTKLAQR